MAEVVFNIRGRAKVFPAVDPGGETKSANTVSDNLVGLPEDEISGVPGVSSTAEDIWQDFGLDSSFLPENAIKSLNKGVETLENISNVFATIMKFLQLFLTSFNSFSSIVSSLLDFVQSEVNKWAQDLAGAGVFFNALFPPAFNPNMIGNLEWQKLSSGGFPGFLNRLQVSLNNTADPNRPIYSSDALVGGLIILVDSETFDDFFKSWRQLGELFDFVNLIPINISPPPPTNIRGVSRLVNGQFQIQLKMDAPPVRPGPIQYRISRSVVPGGVAKQANPVPTKLGGKDGFFRGLYFRLASFFSERAEQRKRTGRRGARELRKIGAFEKVPGDWPPVIVYEYKDRDPAIILSNPINGSGTFIDDQIPKDLNGDPVHKQYYYVVESGFGGSDQDFIGGPRSNEVMVPVEKECIEDGSAAVIEHRRGKREYISAGWGGLGKWSSIQASLVLPFIPKLIDILDKVMKTIQGMVKNTTDSFSDFIAGIQDKFQTYSFMISLMNDIIQQILKLTLGPNIAFLYVKAKKGGVSEFMRRVRTAEQPDRGFSGSNGITAGLVFMFGATSFDPLGNDDEDIINQKSEAISKSFDILMQFLTGG